MEKELLDRIKQTADSAEMKPSPRVWSQLEDRLNTQDHVLPPPAKAVKVFSLRKWSIAASIIVLVGVYGLLNTLGSDTTDAAVVQLEDLHTLEVNPLQNVAPVGESSTIPSIRMARSMNSGYKGINEGSADKKLMKRKFLSVDNQEFGLG